MGQQSRLVGLVVLGMLLPACGFRLTGIPLEVTVKQASWTKRSPKPVERQVRFLFRRSSRGRGWLAVRGLQVDRCRVWRFEKVRTVTTASYERKYLPGRPWGWTAAGVGTVMVGVGIGLMATNTGGFYGAELDRTEARLQQARFLGGLWTFLPGLGLAAAGTTWLLLDKEKVVRRKGPVQVVRHEDRTEDCGVHPLARESFRVGLQGLDVEVSTGPADSNGWAEVDLVDLFAKAPLAVAPRALVVRWKDESKSVELGQATYPAAASILSADEWALAPGRAARKVVLGGPKAPLVFRLVFACDEYLSVRFSVRRAGEGRGGVRRRGSRRRGNHRSRPGTPRREDAQAHGPGVSATLVSEFASQQGLVPLAGRFLCRPEGSPELRLAVRSEEPVHLTVEAEIRPSEPKGRVLRREGEYVLLDKGTADEVLVGRRGVLLWRRKQVGTFEVVRTEADKAAARLEGPLPEDLPARARLRYRLEP